MNDIITIHFLIGIPCSGKSHFAKNELKTKYDLMHLDSDDIREELFKKHSLSEHHYKTHFEIIDEQVDKIFLEQVEKLIKQKINFILDNANYKQKTRKKILNFIRKISKKYNVNVKIIGYYFVIPKNIIKERNIKRAKKKEKSLISEEKLEYYHNAYTHPTLDERFDILIKIKN